MTQFSFVGGKQPKDFYTNHDHPDWVICDSYNDLKEQAKEEGLELETDNDGGFLLRVPYSICPDSIFKCCQNLREVEVFIEGWYSSRVFNEWKSNNKSMFGHIE